MFDAQTLRLWGFERIGCVSVDSGQLIFSDPCYIMPYNEFNEKPGSRGGYSVDYDGLLDYKSEFVYDREDAPPFVEPWGTGLGLVVDTAYGDGTYTVYARFETDSVFSTKHRVIAQVLVDFIGDLSDDDEM